jgi:peptidoglycan/LPS O-acetylase OafA/YrhL
MFCLPRKGICFFLIILFFATAIPVAECFWLFIENPTATYFCGKDKLRRAALDTK